MYLMVKAGVSLPLTLNNFLPPLKLPVGTVVAGHFAPVTWPPIFELFISPMRELLSPLDLKNIQDLFNTWVTFSRLVWLGRWEIGWKITIERC